MPSYCSAINCKNNGFTSHTVSFFKFPAKPLEIRNQWITAMKRDNWSPSKHSRLCSDHFTSDCFFSNRGVRLRLLKDAVPSIFDFRTIPSNRKKAEANALLDMDENDCPDPSLFEFTAEDIEAEDFQMYMKCRICSRSCNRGTELSSLVQTSKGQLKLSEIICQVLGKQIDPNDESDQDISCLDCSKRVTDAYLLRKQLEIKENVTEPCTEDFKSEIILPSPKIYALLTTVPQPRTKAIASVGSEDNFEIYCSACKSWFRKDSLPNHLKTCAMKAEAEAQGIPIETRRLLACSICRFLIYQHNATAHVEICSREIAD